MKNAVDLARKIHDELESTSYIAGRECVPQHFDPESRYGSLLIEACVNMLKRYSIVMWPNSGTVCLREKINAAEGAGGTVFVKEGGVK